MRRSRLAAMDEVAHNRIVAAVEVLAQQAGLDVEAEELLLISARDPKIEALRQREALADILEALAEAEPEHHLPPPAGDYVVLAELEAVDGVGPALMERIREHFAADDDTDNDH